MAYNALRKSLKNKVPSLYKLNHHKAKINEEFGELVEIDDGFYVKPIPRIKFSIDC